MAARELRIECPDCGAHLIVDADSGAVRHAEASEEKRDLGDVVRNVQARGGKNQDLFDQALAAEKNRKRELDALFDQAAEQAREDDEEAPPDSPLDDRWR